jgi:predicted AlkP superfamily pyrophosphatase or phosphodiesterase
MFYHDPVGSPFSWLKYFEVLPDFLMNSRIVSKILKEMGRKILGLGPLFDCGVSPRLLRWFNWVEKKNIYEIGGVIGAQSIFDRMAKIGTRYRVYTYHQWTDAQIVERACADIRARNADFLFLYLSEMDSFLHHNCLEPTKIKGKLSWYDEAIRKIYDEACRGGSDATLTVFSDHGMTPVRKHCDLMKCVADSGLTAPRDYLAIYDSTMARFWFFNDRARGTIMPILNDLSFGRVVSDEELQSMGVFFEDRRFGEVVFLLHPGWMFSRGDFNGPSWLPAGMHGYHPDDPYSNGIFLTNTTSGKPVRTIADVHDQMLDKACR